MIKKLILASAAFTAASSLWAQTSFSNPQEAVRYYEELVGTLTQQVRSLQDENARINANMQNLQRQVEAAMRSSEQAAREVAELRRAISQDAEKRDKQLAKFAQKLTDAASMPQERNDSPVADYEEYIVQPGATLIKISKVYGIPVEAIRKANNMKSDMLRIGDRIRIPRAK